MGSDEPQQRAPGRRAGPPAPDARGPLAAGAGAAAPALSARGVRRALLAIVALALAVRLVHALALARSAFPDFALLATDSDMHAHLAWSDEILAGDLLGRATYHHYTSWMLALGSREDWASWWGGLETFHREPLYPYFLALVRAIVGRGSTLAPLLVQLALSALTPLALYALARRLWDARAGLAAAALGAVYGPFVFYAGAMLRDWTLPIVEPAMLALLLRARERGDARSGFAAGAATGAAILLRATLAALVPLYLAWLAWNERSRPPRLARVGLAFAAGVALALAPLVARNLAVGAPPLALQNRTAEALVESNVAGTRPIGMHVPAALAPILAEARGDVGTVVAAIARSWDGDLAGFLELQALKLAGILDPAERADNADWGFGVSFSPLLAALPGFGLVSALGVAGLLVATRRRADHALVLAHVALSVLGLLLVLVIGRYRLSLAAFLIVWAGGGAVALADALRARRLGLAAVALAAAPAFALARAAWRPAELARRDGTSAERAHEPEFALRVWLERGRHAEAVREAERLAARADDSGDGGLADHARTLRGVAESAWARALLERQDRAGALEHLALARTAFGPDPRDPRSLILLAELALRAGAAEEARADLERFLALAPAHPEAARARALLATAGGR